MLCNTSVGQKIVNSGFVITNAGDTINGTFEASRWNTSPKQIVFNGSNGRALYKPLDIKSFYVDGEFYESTIVNVDHSTNNLQGLNYSSKPLFMQDTLFVQSIFRSTKSLYYYKNESGWSYFFLKDGGNPLEQLVYKKYLIDQQTNGFLKTYAIDNNFYIRQLKVLFNQCPDLATVVEKTKYELNNLESLFIKYAKCSGEIVESKAKAKRIRTDFHFIVGLNKPKVKFNSDAEAFRAFKEGDFQTKVSPDIGLGVSFNSLRRDHLLINFFLLYNNLNVKGNYYSPSEKKTSDMSFRYNCFSGNLNFGLRPIRSIPLYLTLGATIGFLNEKYSKWQETYPSTPPRQKEFQSGNLQSGFISSIGYQLKKIGFEFMYESTNGFSNFNYLSAPTKTFHFLVKYKILNKEE